MINALEMVAVSYIEEPHESHKMDGWESTIVACASNDRLGKVRECKKCEGRDVKAGGAGSRYHDPELSKPCRG